VSYPKQFRWAQWGTVSVGLRANGVAAPTIKTALKRGWIRRIGHGLYEWV